MMPRVVTAELLDGLAASDPAAQRSRRDLRRVHRAMFTRQVLCNALTDMEMAPQNRAPLRILELGAGDGSLMLRVAQALAADWPAVELTLLDRQVLLAPATQAGFTQLGWTVVAQVADVLDWAEAANHATSTATRIVRHRPRWDLVLSNLFLHHFEGAQLASVLRAVAARSNRFLACEPHRGTLALVGSHLVGAIGANGVTRKDAVLSVHAGFRDQEITALWPDPLGEWQTTEYGAGPFSHCFRAERPGASA